MKTCKGKLVVLNSKIKHKNIKKNLRYILVIYTFEKKEL